MASITVTATGTAEVPRHRAEVHLGVEAPAPTPADALAGLTARVERLRGVLGERGVPDADVATQHLHVQPRFDHQRGVPDGTSAGTTVVVSLASLDDVPGLLAAVVEEGVQVHHVTQVPEVTDEVEAAARRAAVGVARERATQLAEAVGGTLGGLLSLLEGGPPPSVVPMAARAAPAMVEAAHVWERRSEATVTVTAVYELVETPAPPSPGDSAIR